MPSAIPTYEIRRRKTLGAILGRRDLQLTVSCDNCRNSRQWP